MSAFTHIDKSLFQLTRSRGAWLPVWPLLSEYSNFNSHAHVERDIITLRLHLILKHFNSHAHVERDVLDTLEKSAETEFQLTRSRGAWHGFKNKTMELEHFNSHAHVERDYSQYHMASYPCHFNSHAHVERDSCFAKFVENV